MHYPQLPDPNGVDVDFAPGAWLADDWTCSETGPVTDIHLWHSWLGDDVGQVLRASVAIHADDRSGNFSQPGAELWSRTFSAGEFTIRPAGTGNQAYFFTSTGIGVANDHTQYFQLNIDEIDDPFEQQEGEIYWLLASLEPSAGNVGWKTSGSPPHEDGAVWGNPPNLPWAPLRSLLPGAIDRADLAFVITGGEPIPEPATLALAAFGLTALGGYVRKRRRA
jgi:hypothetical protein